MLSAHCCDEMGHNALGEINNRVADIKQFYKTQTPLIKGEFDIAFYSNPSLIYVFGFEGG